MNRRMFRHWIGRCQFPDCAGFSLGTVQAHTEIEALQKLERLWAEIIPYPFPSNVTVMPGLLAFYEEELAE